jgi:hypothetical protein
MICRLSLGHLPPDGFVDIVLCYGSREDRHDDCWSRVIAFDGPVAGEYMAIDVPYYPEQDGLTLKRLSVKVHSAALGTWQNSLEAKDGWLPQREILTVDAFLPATSVPAPALGQIPAVRFGCECSRCVALRSGSRFYKVEDELGGPHHAACECSRCVGSRGTFYSMKDHRECGYSAAHNAPGVEPKHLVYAWRRDPPWDPEDVGSDD